MIYFYSRPYSKSCKWIRKVLDESKREYVEVNLFSNCLERSDALRLLCQHQAIKLHAGLSPGLLPEDESLDQEYWVNMIRKNPSIIRTPLVLTEAGELIDIDLLEGLSSLAAAKDEMAKNTFFA